MKSKKFLAGVLVGLAAGALAGILAAPESGKNTRQKLGGKSKSLLDTIEGLASTIGEKAKLAGFEAQNKLKDLNKSNKDLEDKLGV